jgi:Zn-dependent protease
LDHQLIIERLTLLIPLWLSLSVHECAHAWAAYRLGDDTARLLGRLTLNPLTHIDPIGTLILPLLGVPFGWAKPVPVNPLRFNRRIRMSTGMMLVALAGPASNVVLAVISAVGFSVLLRFHPDPEGTAKGLGMLLTSLVFINCTLAAFNMLPVPPLDGSRIVDGLLPDRYRHEWQKLASVGPIAIFALIMVCNATRFPLFRWANELGLWLIAMMMSLFG